MAVFPDIDVDKQLRAYASMTVCQILILFIIHIILEIILYYSTNLASASGSSNFRFKVINNILLSPMYDYLNKI